MFLTLGAISKPTVVVPATPVSLINRGILASSTATNTATYTISNYGIGAASSTRRVIVGVHYGEFGTNQSARSIVSATIGGVAAAIDAQVSRAGSRAAGSAVISATVPTGTTANIVINFDAALENRVALTVYGIAVDNLQSVAPYSIKALTSTSGVIATLADGLVIAGATSRNSSPYATSEWSGVSEQIDTGIGDYSFSYADLLPSAANPALTVTDTMTWAAGAIREPAFFALSYR